MSICPKCGMHISKVRLNNMPVDATGKQWVGVAYCCPACSVILSVAIDPIALKADIVSEVVLKLRALR